MNSNKTTRYAEVAGLVDTGIRMVAPFVKNASDIMERIVGAPGSPLGG